jgi:DNA-binding transcriptional LysR family regulator
VDAPIDLNLLRVFTLLGEIGSFSDAARKLGLPRSSVSRQIAALEEQVGTSLFNRTTRRVALSTAGAAFYSRLVPQLAALESSLGSLPERDESPSGDLRLSAPPDLGAVVLPEILAGFCARFPGIHLEVSLSPRMVDLVADQFDAAIRVSRGRLADSSLVARKLGTLELDLFASPLYLARAKSPIRTPRDTALHDWVLCDNQPLRAPFPKPERRPRVVSDDMLFVAEALIAGLGIGLLPVLLAREAVAAGRLVRLLPREWISSGAIYFVYPKAQQTPRKVTALRDYLLGHIAAHPLTPTQTAA